ncbi:EAL domain-containing protein [Roseivivax sediminis]|uniref:EAL domain, c-di-GMP-specific phosphodiesterase class I (Or its enzymatically inactive variant) n=1 Tax=Roseivivax sediminis TaxID=936889 RepID=A0A1I2DWX1_9RHOB|nr:EAL domain-containing protein [Roseivivax sediminis]SFE85115.1 EAL domain, c-di-GMP-specific phosphodiesterase class I (or its enzymatically inactive variant) [Roseivivax sediminis]
MSERRDTTPKNALVEAVSIRDSHMRAMADEAVRHKQVRLAFQPVVQAAAPDRVAFYEAFVRVLDDTGRIIPAAAFMSAVEETETGRLLDCIALEQAFAHLRDEPALRLAVNMSARSLGYARWRRALDQGLKSDPTLGERLILEINEASAMRVPDIAQAFMAEMQTSGITFALDDFGATVTELRHLRTLPVDIVKIDGAYVRGVARDPDNEAMVRALAAIAQSFDYFTVAESVETAEDAAFLTEIGIDCLQGYFFAAPTLSPPWADRRGRRRA